MGDEQNAGGADEHQHRTPPRSSAYRRMDRSLSEAKRLGTTVRSHVVANPRRALLAGGGLGVLGVVIVGIAIAVSHSGPRRVAADRTVQIIPPPSPAAGPAEADQIAAEARADAADARADATQARADMADAARQDGEDRTANKSLATAEPVRPPDTTEADRVAGLKAARQYYTQRAVRTDGLLQIPRTQPDIRCPADPLAIKAMSDLWPSVSRLQFSPYGSLLFATSGESTLLTSYPDLTAVPFSDDFIGRPLSINRWYDELATQYDKKPLQPTEAYRLKMRQLVAAGTMLPPHLLFLSGDKPTFAALGHRTEGPWNPDAVRLTPSVAFWQMNDGTLHLTNVHSLALPEYATHGHPEWYGAAAYGSKVAILVAGSDRMFDTIRTRRNIGAGSNSSGIGIGSDMRLGVWDASGLIGSVPVPVTVGGELDLPTDLAVEPTSGCAALLYGNAIRIVDLSHLQGSQAKLMPLAELSNPAASRDDSGFVEFTPDGKTLVAYQPLQDPALDAGRKSTFGRIQMVRVADWKPVATVDALTTSGNVGMTGHCLSGDGSVLLTAEEAPGNGTTLRGWAIPDGRLLWQRQTTCGGVASPLGKRQFVTGVDSRRMSGPEQPRHVTVWEAVTGEIVVELPGSPVSAVVGSPTDGRVVVGSPAHVNIQTTVSVWNPAVGPTALYADEFDALRRTRMNETNAADLWQAPYVRLADYDKLQVGMNYAAVRQQLMGAGVLPTKATGVNHSQYVIRYLGFGASDAACELTFEGPIQGVVADDLRLVSKSQTGLR